MGSAATGKDVKSPWQNGNPWPSASGCFPCLSDRGGLSSIQCLGGSDVGWEVGGGRLFLPVGQGSGVLEKPPGALIRWQQSQMSLKGWAGVDKSLPFTVDTAGEAWEAPSSPGVAWALSSPTVPRHGMPSDGGWRSPRIVNHVGRYFWGQGEICR